MISPQIEAYTFISGRAKECKLVASTIGISITRYFGQSRASAGAMYSA
jgi:hypothetical protein